MGLYDSFTKQFDKWIGIAEAPSSGSGGGASRDPLQTIIKRVGLALGVGQNRNEAQPPDFDLTEITTAYDTEAYVRQSIDKYIEMMFKSGWDITGSNENAIEYIRMRLKLMAEMTKTPTDQLFIDIAEDLVKYSNAVIAKARDKQGLLGSSQTGVQAQGLGGQPPIAGYFPLNVTTLAVVRDRNGTIRRWEQEVEGQQNALRFNPQNIVHIYYKREKGRAFGTPFLLSVLDDIRALRQAEENVLRLIYRNLNPLLHIKVGTDEIPARQPEIDEVQTNFENMDLEAGFVTSERVSVDSIASNQIIDAENYIKYFEQRVFTGLGVSELMMGRGNTANRSTGDNLSNEFTDRVKAFQKVIAIFIDEFIIKELLMEGGFDPVLNPDDAVNFKFKEIDVDAKIKAENHAIFQYEHNAITEDEMRNLLGRDPITDRAQMHMNLVTIEIAKQTEAASSDNSEGGSADTNNRSQPRNQNTESEETEFKKLYLEGMERIFDSSHNKVISLLGEYYNADNNEHLDKLSETIRNTEKDLLTTMEHYLGIDYVSEHTHSVHRLCERLYEEIMDSVSTTVGEQKDTVVYETVGGIYHVLQMRVNDIALHSYNTYLTKEVQ